MRDARFERRVLVVDDDQDSAELLVLLLEMHGHHARTAHTGADALRAASEFRPQVAILDVGLPDMTGYELAALLRQREDLANCKLIAVTGYSGAAELKKSKISGIDLHLVKPVDLTTLARSVAESAFPLEQKQEPA